LAVLPTMLAKPKGMAERTHGGFTMANTLFETKCPVAPVDRSYKSLSAWVQAEVAPWVEKRRDGVDDTRFQFAQSKPQTPSDQVVSAAVVGLLQEDTALTLQTIPQPAELDAEPEIAEMYRDVIRSQANPLLGAALTAYRDCANIGYREGGELERWAKFCHARYDRLRADNKDLESREL
jgi:hypothetical protein